MNGHLQAVKILADSFQTWPLCSSAPILTSDILAQLLQQASQLALLLIAPALATLTLTNLGLGLLGASGLPGASTAIGNTTRSAVAVLVLMASLTGIQQTISDSVQGSIAIMTDTATSSR
jgi:type III secretory pathway component EscT